MDSGVGDAFDFMFIYYDGLCEARSGKTALDGSPCENMDSLAEYSRRDFPTINLSNRV